MVNNMYYLNCFFIYSFIGFIYENIIEFVRGKKPGSGMLYGPFTPIYGIGALLILVISKFIFNILNLNKVLEVIIIVLSLTIILTVLEWIVGILIEKIFHVTFWNYSNFKFHIGKYVALEVSFIWALGSLLVIYVLQPLINKFIFSIPSYVTYILIIIFTIDLVVTFSSKKVHK